MHTHKLAIDWDGTCWGSKSHPQSHNLSVFRIGLDKTENLDTVILSICCTDCGHKSGPDLEISAVLFLFRISDWSYWWKLELQGFCAISLTCRFCQPLKDYLIQMLLSNRNFKSVSWCRWMLDQEWLFLEQIIVGNFLFGNSPLQ